MLFTLDGLYHPNHVLEGIVNEVLGTLNLLQMNLGALEGQTRGDYFLDAIASLDLMMSVSK